MVFNIQDFTKYSIRDRKHILKLCFLIPNLRKKKEKPYPMGTYYKRGQYKRYMKTMANRGRARMGYQEY